MRTQCPGLLLVFQSAAEAFQQSQLGGRRRELPPIGGFGLTRHFGDDSCIFAEEWHWRNCENLEYCSLLNLTLARLGVLLLRTRDCDRSVSTYPGVCWDLVFFEWPQHGWLLIWCILK